MLVNDDDFVYQDKLNDTQHLMSTIYGDEVNLTAFAFVSTLVLRFMTWLKTDKNLHMTTKTSFRKFYGLSLAELIMASW